MDRGRGWQMRAYLALSHALPLAAPFVLRRRLARGREDPARWREKLGETGVARPPGPLVWMHGVGVGEVMALRGLIAAMAERMPALQFLVTSTARSSAQVMGTNLPPRTIHQFLPLDAPRYVAAFLDHWRPGLSVWAEQDLWPCAVMAAAARGIPLALVNARMDAASFARRQRLAGVYRDCLAAFGHLSAQDAQSADHLARLAGRRVEVTGSLKAAAPPLACDEGELVRLRAALAGRPVWAATSTHPGDVEVALSAQRLRMQSEPESLLILAPRDPDPALDTAGLPLAVRSQRQAPVAGVYLADTYGELGLWYRLAPVALVGGGFGIGGHNPWEAARLGCAVLHGPDVANFAKDYEAFQMAGAARVVVDAKALAQALADPALPAMALRGRALAEAGMAGIGALADRLLDMVEA